MLAIQMKRPPLRDWVWVSLNSLIAVVFLWLSSAEWREPELKAVPVGVAGPLFIMALWVIRLHRRRGTTLPAFRRDGGVLDLPCSLQLV
jgi:hypothetical protein